MMMMKIIYTKVTITYPKILIILTILGNLLEVLTDRTQRVTSYSPDLCLYGNTVVVPHCDDKSVLMYDLVTDERRENHPC